MRGEQGADAGSPTYTVSSFYHSPHTPALPFPDLPRPTGIKAIKLYAWEKPYVERISELREQELKSIRRWGTGAGAGQG